MSRFTLEWEISNQNVGMSIKEFLKVQEISKAALTDIKFKGGVITVNSKEVTVRYTLVNGDRLKIVFPEELPSEGLNGEKIPLSLIYEDDFLMVINKEAGMSTIPSREHPDGSFANALVGYYQEKGVQATAHIVTRLDRDTSGLVLVAKHRHVHHLLTKQQKNGNVKRKYEAFVEGSMQNQNGTIEVPIGRKSESIIEREVRKDGQFARTHFSVIEQFSTFTWIELELDTGRTHQIRVHLSYLGHPLIGDDLYGGSKIQLHRQALHCKQITFYHPLLQERLTFVAALPNDMKHYLDCATRK